MIHSRITGHPTAQVPGVPGEEFSNIFRTFGSPNGGHWIFKGLTNAAAAQNDVIIVGTGLSSFLAAKEASPTPVAGTTYSFMDLLAGVNDSGQYAFGTRLIGAPATSDEVIFTGDGATTTVAAREGDPAPGLTDTPPTSAGDELLGNSLDSAHVLGDGTVVFAADSILNAASNNNSALYAGSSVLAQEGTSIGGGGGTYTQFLAFGGNNFTVNSVGDWISLVDDDPAAGLQISLVVNNNVQTSVEDPLPGFAAPIAGLGAPTLDAAGNWIYQANLANFAGAVVKNGAVVAASGDPVEPGGAELFITPVVPTPTPFFAATGNPQGHVLVGGNTTHPSPLFNQVLVLVDNRVLVRKGDPVDLNANGIVSDDDAKIGSFANNSAFISKGDSAVIFTATLQTLAGASLGEGLLRGTSACLVDADCEDQLFCTGGEQCVSGACQSSGNPCAAGEACIEALDQCLPAIPGDADLDGDVDEGDYRQWVNHFGQPASSDSASSDFNGSGTVDAADYAVLQNNFGQSY